MKIQIRQEDWDSDIDPVCNCCGCELPPVHENNGFSMPEGPEHYDFAGWGRCVECDDNDEFSYDDY